MVPKKIIKEREVRNALTAKFNNLCLLILGFGFYLLPLSAEAGGKTLGSMASSITGTFTSLAKLITAGSYLAGLGFAIGAILKFKQHKDNPTQIPIGTPIALTFIAAALLFLPSILGVTGQTMFGGAGSVAGPGGIIFS